jgi:alkylation response protein AidB-like acyl-CoA dehydrogenase
VSAPEAEARDRAEQDDFAREARDFVEEHVAPLAATIDREERLPPALVRRLVERGWLGSRAATRDGGLELDITRYGILHEQIGRACASTRSLLTVHDMVTEVVQRLGARELRDKWLVPLARGDVVAAFALTEPHAGSDAASITTTVTLDGSTCVIDGVKTWISFGQLADVILVLARLGEDGASAGVLVPRDTPGLTVTPIRGMLGLRGSMLAELRFEQCRVPRVNLLGSPRMPAGLIAATALQLGRFSVAWGCVGLASACLDASLAHARERMQFGKAIGDHQLVRRLLAEMATNTRAARLLALDAAASIERGDPRASEAVLMAKYHASRTATRASADAVQIHGALGCSNLLPVERHFRDARVMEIIEGSTQIQEILIAKQLLAGGRRAPAAGADGGGG